MGSLLLDEEHAGKLFVKGIWINDMHEQGLVTGVDLNNMKVDRDRLATLEQGAVDHIVSTMWLKSIQSHPELLPRYMALLEREGCSDVKYCSFYADRAAASV